MFKYLIDNGGYLTLTDAAALAAFEPDFKLIVKYNNGVRMIYRAGDIPKHDQDQIDSIFISAQVYCKIVDLMAEFS